MNCRIIYKDNKIDHVQAENGERSILFDSLKDIFSAEKALELYALTEEDGYKQKIQEKVRSFVGVTEKQIDKLSEVIDAQETLNKLEETGLAENVYQMTSEELEAKLVELGVDANVAKQVSQSGGYYSNANTAFSNLKDKNVKNVQGWMKALTDVQKNGGIKNVNQELEWIGLEDYLNDYVKENNPKAGNIPSSVVEEYIKSNQIEIVDVSKGGDFKGVSYQDIDRAELIPNDRYGGYYVYYKSGFIDKVYGVGSIDEAMSQSIRESNFAESNNIQPTKYEGYQLKGGENYREVLLTMPSTADTKESKEHMDYIKFLEDKYNTDLDMMGGRDELSKDELEKLKQLAEANYDSKKDKIQNEYSSSHWSEKNILAHVRLNEKTLPDGRRVLVVVELQSDWNQQGKKQGFGNEGKETLQKAIKEKEGEVDNIINERAKNKLLISDEMSDSEYDSLREVNKELANKAEVLGKELYELRQRLLKINTVPNNPFQKTDQWTGLVMRKVMQMASQEGYSGIAFATGQQSADMYSLSQQVDKIDITPQGEIKAVYISMKNNADDTVFINQEGIITESASGVYNGKQAEEVLGKDLTRKILETEEETTLEGEGLEFGGEGMKTFYDKIVPKVAQKEAQRFDKNAKLETVDFSEKTNVDIAEEDGGFILKVNNEFVEYVDEETLLNSNLENTKEGAKKYFEKYIPQEINSDKLSLGVQPYLPLTQSIKDSVSQGIPQFQKSGITPITNGFIHNNDVYLNKDTATEETEIHEFNHLYNNWLKQNRPEVYKKGLDLVKIELKKKNSEIQDIIDFVKTNQPNLEGEALQEEILTEMVGRRSAELLKRSKEGSKIKEWLQEFWDEIKKLLNIFELTNEEFLSMTLKDYADYIGTSLMNKDMLIERLIDLNIVQRIC